MTLVEMMVSLAIFAVAMGVIFTFLVNSRRSYSNVSERVEYQQSIRGAFTLVTRELRSAGCDPQQVGFNRFLIANAQHLQCRMDLDGDGIIEIVEPAEDVTYQFQPAAEELTRDMGNGPQTILRNVTGLSFRYFDGDGTPLATLPLSSADRDAIRFVEIDIAGESDRGEPVNYVARILIRNG